MTNTASANADQGDLVRLGHPTTRRDAGSDLGREDGGEDLWRGRNSRSRGAGQGSEVARRGGRRAAAFVDWKDRRAERRPVFRRGQDDEPEREIRAQTEIVGRRVGIPVFTADVPSANSINPG